MALDPVDEIHALQIQAGPLGRRAGHSIEDSIAREINSLTFPYRPDPHPVGHVFTGDPAMLLLAYIAERLKINKITSSTAISTGALATSEEGKKWLSVNGAKISRCKSDIVVTM